MIFVFAYIEDDMRRAVIDRAQIDLILFGKILEHRNVKTVEDWLHKDRRIVWIRMTQSNKSSACRPKKSVERLTHSINHELPKLNALDTVME